MPKIANFQDHRDQLFANFTIAKEVDKQNELRHMDIPYKKKFFLTDIIIHENKGGANHQVGEKRKFWPDRNFWPMGWPGTPKFGRMKLFGRIDHHLSRFLILNKKQKSYGALKLVIQNFEKKLVAPPFEMKQPVRNPFTWDDKYAVASRVL